MPRPPKDFEGFVGQRRAVKTVERLVNGATRAGRPAPHLLLIGPPGHGKSKLADAIGRAVASAVQSVSSPLLTTKSLCRMLHQMEASDILFVDEAHVLKPSVLMTLHEAMDNKRAPDPDSETPNVPKSISEFTLIAATNRPGELPKAFRSRFFDVAMDDYTTVQLVEIAKRVAEELDIAVTGQAARRLADQCEGSPRQIRKWVEMVHLYHHGSGRIELPMVVEFLAEGAGLDQHGLDGNQRRYLRVLAEHPDHAMTQEALIYALGCDRGTVVAEVEPVLFRRGITKVTGRGRALTSLGRSLAGVTEVENVEDGSPDGEA